MDDKLRELAEEAYSNYSSVLVDIDRIKTDISHVRQGKLELSEIQTDKERLHNRISREGTAELQALERINGEANFQDIRIIQRIVELSRAVGRITTNSRLGNTGYGTGFLIAPNLVLTNNHVLGTAEVAANSTIQFNYELDQQGNPNKSESFNLLPDEFFVTSHYKKDASDPYSGLDFTIVAVEKVSNGGTPISTFPTARLDKKLGKIIDGENCAIVQHPKGDYKKIVMKDIRMLVLKDDFLIYESDTLPGSSGSMVLGLGTGEVVALHHSAVPRKNRHGQWLRKDGSVVQPGDPDNMIDWMGNEGIRVSSILNMIAKIPVPKPMEKHKAALVGTMDTERRVAPSRVENRTTSSKTYIMNRSESTKVHTLYFEIQLSEVKEMQQDWKANAASLVPGLVLSEPLYPMSTEKAHRNFFYIEVESEKSPWEVAADLEGLPQIETCTPDLEMATDIKPGHYGRWSRNESLESLDDGTADWDKSEGDFKIKWANAHLVKDYIQQGKSLEYRGWNRKAVQLDKVDLDQKIPTDTNIKLVQLDTGYTDHNKVLDGYNLLYDEDFIDGEDARDEMSMGILRQPGHGTRTASIVVGKQANGTIKNDGNQGVVVSKEDKALVKVIPYRISKSVILIGRGRNLFDAVSQAINAEADIIFMCMGSYPRPMIYSIAKTAYERGIIWVCAAGNKVESVIAPAVYPGTIAVAATNPNNEPWRYTSYGPAVDIAAPGEDVYVPFKNKRQEDIMVFGSGTSYATPHVASAAALWKAKHSKFIKDHVKEPWQVVELFRKHLKETAEKDPNGNGSTWDEERFGAGILSVKKLLELEMPTEDGEIKKLLDGLTHAYKDKEKPAQWDLGVRETVHFLWNTARKKLTPGFESTTGQESLTERARISVAAMTGRPVNKVFESYDQFDEDQTEKLLKVYFESFN
ncbi:S8 family serine peptidase [Pseudozobellia thermophila]|uniref:Serine protease n=1 Tax=Pseudozobellia thermophila TaxID=192903 RepID=A0A1M6M7K8_9FLAO|nr:S8 family serine peptidase [Pseudozobellia thermophila]SHJ79439.1 Trypsin-like peptidase domain-containing protein [Pseudozobellia thermophila]